MKTKITLFSIAVYLFLALQVNAQTRVLNNDEREILLTSATFKTKCQWAVRDYAAYWSIHDGSGLSTEADRIRWAKDRQLSIEILKNDTKDQDLALRFLNSSKGRQFTLTAPTKTESQLLDVWTPAVYDEFAAEYFKLLGDNLNFSIGN